MQLPRRYIDYFKDIWVDVPEAGTVSTSVGPVGYVGRRWVCRQCAKAIKPNTAAAQSHIAKHVREREKESSHA